MCHKATRILTGEGSADRWQGRDTTSPAMFNPPYWWETIWIWYYVGWLIGQLEVKMESAGVDRDESDDWA